MAKNDFWSKNPDAMTSDLPPFLTTEDKEYFAKETVPFLVYGILKGHSNYGDCWWVNLKVGPEHLSDGLDGFRRTLTFNERGSGSSRDLLLAKMANYFVEGGIPFACILESFYTQAGNLAYSLAPTDQAVTGIEGPSDFDSLPDPSLPTDPSVPRASREAAATASRQRAAEEPPAETLVEERTARRPEPRATTASRR